MGVGAPKRVKKQPNLPLSISRTCLIGVGSCGLGYRGFRKGYDGGREWAPNKDCRLAPFGRTGHRYGEKPHYHRRVYQPNGKVKPGQGVRRHRPWETKSTDISFWDRC